MSTSTHKSRIPRWRILLLGLLCLAPLCNLDAQPTLSFKRVTVNWPTIEMYFSLGCDGKPTYDVKKENIRIVENGEEIKKFTVWCPDPSIRCIASIALVMDVSGSMRGDPMIRAKASATAFVHNCDGIADQVAVIRAAEKPYVALPFTTFKPPMLAAIDSCTASGATALYDGILLALAEMINTGVNQCRAILVFTDGGDVSSSTTTAEIIALANRHRLRIFTIGYDEYGPKTDLEMIAHLTGGKYYYNPNPTMMTAIYDEITTIMFAEYQECIITYERGCANGSLRTVELGIQDYCKGADSQTKTYRAPLDSSTYQILNVEIPLTQIEQLQIGTVPVMLDGPAAMLQPFELTVRYDPLVTFLGTDVPSGSLLFGIAHEIDQQPGLITIRGKEPLPIGGRAKLLDLKFRAASVADTLTSAIVIESMIIPTGCLLPVIHNNPVIVGPRMLPIITASAYEFCAGDSVTLEANEGFTKYFWSTGASTRSIRTAEGGMFSVSVVDANGDTLHASPVTITRYELPVVGIFADGPIDLCRGKTVNLVCTGDTARAGIRWSNGYSGKSLKVSASGKYWVEITSPFGCSARSDTIEVTVTDLPVRVLPGYRIDLCPGDSVVLSLEGDYQEVTWVGKSSKTHTVHWRDYGTVSVSAAVIDASGCRGISDVVIVTMLRRKTPSLTPSGIVELCPGGEFLLTADSGYVAYHWTTGEISQSILVRQPGLYAAEVTDEYGCRFETDTVQVIGVASPHPRIRMLGSPQFCSTDTITLDGGANYLAWRWNTGASTRTISVADSGMYWVEVTGYGGCTGISDTVITDVEQVPSMFDPVVRGSLPLCPGDTLWLDAPEDMLHWLWNTGIRARSLPVTQAGRYAVTVVTLGGCEARSSFVDVTMTTSKSPTIVRAKDALSTGAAQSYQWRRNGIPIPGATQQTVVARELGSYTVTVLDEFGCTMTSAPFLVNILSIGAPIETDDLLLYPDPVNDWLHFVFPADSRNARVTLVSLLGQVLAEQESSGESNTRTMRIDLSALPAGVYLLQASAGEKWWVRKVVKK